MLWKILLFVVLYIFWVMGSLAVAFDIFAANQPPGTLPLPAVIFYLVAIMVPVWLFTKWFNASPGWTKKVLAEGRQAPATILEVKNTGMVINNTVAVVKLKLRVEPNNDAPFEVSQDKRISMIVGLGDLTPGTRVQVKYDPTNRKHLVILDSSDDVAPARSSAPAYPRHARQSSYAAAADSPDVVRELEQLSDLHRRGDLSADEFEAAKKKLLG